MSRRSEASTALAMLVVVALVCYLSWWQAGELELLNRRVDEHEQELARKRRAPAKKKEPEAKS